MDLMKTIENIGIVPVVVIDDANFAEGLAGALIKGGIPCAEVTFRTAAAEEAIKRMSSSHPELLLGAGTVVTVQQAQKAVDAGAKFLVSPGYDQNLVDWASEKGVPYFPGVCTASEVQVAVAHGLNVLKFFPSEAAGGVSMIKNLCGPFPQVKFMTTGGINAANISSYASCRNVLAVGGSWMVKSDLIRNCRWDEISGLCREAVLASLGFKVIHVGINTDSMEDAQNAAKRLALFGFPFKTGNSSTFSGTEIEIMHKQFRGKCGHIGIKTNSIERAVAYLGQFGFTVCQETVSLNADGKMKVCYFNEEIAGFAVHLVI